MIHVVYFNQWFSSIGTVIEDIKTKAKEDGILLRIIGSSTNSDHAYKNIVDKFYTEDWDEGNCIQDMETNYINWVLNLCKNEGVDVFFAKKHSNIINKHIKDFDEAGIKVISCADLDAIASKKSTYERISNSTLKYLVPEYFKGDNSEDLMHWLADRFEDGLVTIMKLNEDEGGASYKEIVDKGPYLNQIIGYYGQKVSFADVQRLINDGNLKDFIFMEYLSDPEISVDCYKSKDDVIAIAREKSKGRIQKIFVNEELYKLAVKLSNMLDLNKLFNFQIRFNKSGEYSLLEINPRISGGAYIETAVGYNLMYLALIDALGLSTKYTKKFMHNWEGIQRRMVGNTSNIKLGTVTKIENTVVLDQYEY